jgi:glutathione peroxidase
MTQVYDFIVTHPKQKVVSLKSFEGKVLLIVNTATHCGYTKQYEGLEKLYQAYNKRGLEILDFPSNTFLQTPEDDQAISEFCALKYKTSFTTFAKVDVNGPTSIPLYQWLRQQNDQHIDTPIRWNFTKFLINRQGKVIGRFDSKVTPEELDALIQPLL